MLLGCEGGTAPAAPQVLFAGCERVLAGPVCVLRPDATLRIWVDTHPESRLILTNAGAAVPTTWTAVEDGLRTAVEVAAPATLELGDTTAGWRWKLTLMPETGEGLARVEALQQRGNAAYRHDLTRPALAAYEAAYVAAIAEGAARRAREIMGTAIHICLTAQDRNCAQVWIDREAALGATVAEARVLHEFHAGQVARRDRDVPQELQHYLASVALARKLGLVDDLAAGLSALGSFHAHHGDLAAAEAAFAELRALGDAVRPDLRALWLHNAAWATLAAQARGVATADPRPGLRAALAAFSPGGAFPDTINAAESRLNLVHAELIAGDAAAARTVLAPLVPPTRRVHRWQLFLEARVELAEGHPAAALGRFEALMADAGAAFERELEWSAAVGAGEALEALDANEAALDRYRCAADLHAAELAGLGVDGERDRFAAERDRGAQRLVSLLLRLGRVDEAACAARQARAQAFAGLATQARDPAVLAKLRAERERFSAAMDRTWELPHYDGEQARAHLRADRQRLDAWLAAALAGVRRETPATCGGDPPAARTTASPQDDPTTSTDTGANPAQAAACAALRPPGPGELVLVYYPLERGQVGFALTPGQTRGVLLPETATNGPGERATQLLGPFATELTQATRLRIVASGATSAEAFHALPWADGSLVDHVPIAYALDLPRRAPGPTRPRRALQLQPPSNLRGADAELAATVTALEARGFEILRRVGPEPDLLRELGEVTLLHFVGHARGGWGGGLDLGGERRLGPRDLLAGPAPTLAVLGGCETGLPDPDAHAGGMSLAHALLLAGSEAVIATDAAVDDDLAAALTPPLIAALADGVDPAEALRRAQRAIAAGHPGWVRFRAFEP